MLFSGQSDSDMELKDGGGGVAGAGWTVRGCVYHLLASAPWQIQCWRVTERTRRRRWQGKAKSLSLVTDNPRAAGLVESA